MKKFVLETKRTVYLVTLHDDGLLSISLKEGGDNIPNIGAFIVGIGGKEKLIDRCLPLDVPFSQYLENKNLKDKQEATARKQQFEAEKEKREALVFNLKMQRQAQWEKLSALPVIPVNGKNLKIVLSHLHDQNWGSWRLPSLSCGYSAHQYDCDGVTATTITLDEPLTDEKMYIFEKRKFKVGGKRGHLMDYFRL